MFDVGEVPVEDIQRKAICLLGKGEMNAVELCDNLDIKPEMRNKLNNGEYYTAFKERIGLQIADDAEIDELIQEKRLDDIPNHDIFSLTKKGEEKYNQILKENEVQTDRRNNKITTMATVIGVIVGLVGLIYMIMKDK